ncbi:MAG: hypothetical protein GY909_09030 [Oligoflexia bacterium]|nr:hypothetical protein [Oligoflexia bacterium]
MSLKLGNIVLFSRSPKTLGSFLSDIFDSECITLEDQSFYVDSEVASFKILPSSSEQMFAQGGERDFLIEIESSSLEELEDFLHKIQFLKFRHGHTEEQGKVELSKEKNNYFFYVRDPDGRRWKFFWRSVS